MSTATLIPLLAAQRRVDVKAIDRELAELWRAAAASSEAERIALSRARTLTPAAERLFRDLGEIVDRVIVDTAAVPDGHGALLAAHTLAADRSSHAALSDLTWGRMTTWRGLTAHFFDPPHTEALDRITRIRVAHAGSSRAQGLLYVGWLAGRMRWRVEQPFIRGDGPWRGTLVDQRGRAIPVSLHAESRAPHPAGALLSTLIVTGSPAGQNGGATFSIARKDDAGSVLAVAEREHRQGSRRAPPLAPPGEGPLLGAGGE